MFWNKKEENRLNLLLPCSAILRILCLFFGLCRAVAAITAPPPCRRGPGSRPSIKHDYFLRSNPSSSASVPDTNTPRSRVHSTNQGMLAFRSESGGASATHDAIHNCLHAKRIYMKQSCKPCTLTHVCCATNHSLSRRQWAKDVEVARAHRRP